MQAVVYGMEYFDRYTYGRQVLVESYHKPLQAIFKKPLMDGPRRLQRMLLRLQRYTLALTFKPGKELLIADTLSRAAVSSNHNQPNSQRI